MTISVLKKRRERGFLDGHFLIAMPNMADSNFTRTVVYICAHSDDGAMGFVINRPQPLNFSDVLLHLQLVGEEEVIRLPDTTLDFPIRSGGPVESGRGFVLHSDDYMSESSIPVSDDICLTATLDIVKAITRGRGPRRGLMMLGYAGWGAGQIESEIGANGWLTCPAEEELIFDTQLDSKYDRALALMGIAPGTLSAEAGHA